MKAARGAYCEVGGRGQSPGCCPSIIITRIIITSLLVSMYSLYQATTHDESKYSMHRRAVLRGRWSREWVELTGLAGKRARLSAANWQPINTRQKQIDMRARARLVPPETASSLRAAPVSAREWRHVRCVYYSTPQSRVHRHSNSGVCVCVCERERESVCVCVCV